MHSIMYSPRLVLNLTHFYRGPPARSTDWRNGYWYDVPNLKSWYSRRTESSAQSEKPEVGGSTPSIYRPPLKTSLTFLAVHLLILARAWKMTSRITKKPRKS